MQKFAIKINGRKDKSRALELQVQFNEAEELANVAVDLQPEQELSRDVRQWLWNFIPKSQSELSVILKHEGVEVMPIQEDLSFERFWEKYDHKVGKKDRAKKLWNDLPDLERHRAIKMIPKYNFWLVKTGINKVYPETYLSQKRYHNEF